MDFTWTVLLSTFFVKRRSRSTLINGLDFWRLVFPGHPALHFECLPVKQSQSCLKLSFICFSVSSASCFISSLNISFNESHIFDMTHMIMDGRTVGTDWYGTVRDTDFWYEILFGTVRGTDFGPEF